MKIEPRLFIHWDSIDLGIRDLIRYFISNYYARETTGEIFADTLDQLDPERRKLVLFQLKLNIESGYEGMPVTQEWEKMRFDNIQDCSKLTLFGSCSNCKSEYPFQMKLLDFHTFPKTILYIVDPQIDVTTRRTKCERCGKDDGLGIVPFWHPPDKPMYFGHFDKTNASYTTA